MSDRTQPTPRVPPAWHRRAALLVAALLNGCGGGLYFDGTFDDPPEIDLALAVDSATAGTVVRLAAAASDDDFVDRVRFYRIDGADDLLLGIDESSPWQWDVTVPNLPVGTVLRFFAQAVDSAGQRSSSRVVELRVAGLSQ